MGATATSAEALAGRYWEALLPLRPSIATQVGDERYDDLLEDPSGAGRDELRHLAERTIMELDALEGRQAVASAPGPEDAVTADVLRFMCEIELEVAETGYTVLESVDHMDHGPQVVLVMLAQVQRADTPERLDRWLARLAAYPRFVATHVERIREASARGVLPARIVTERVIEQLTGLLDQPAETSTFTMAPPVANATAPCAAAR